jgi:hypothetical protein
LVVVMAAVVGVGDCGGVVVLVVVVVVMVVVVVVVCADYSCGDYSDIYVSNYRRITNTSVY